MTRADAIDRAHQHLHSGEFLAELDRRVGYQTESQNPERRDALRAYLEEELQPAFAQLDFATRLVESPTGKGPYLVAEYRESSSAPTVLMYGHGDVVDGMTGEWRDNLDPWRTTTVGNRVYGRGTADNKGQHSINLSALRAVREARGGRLGFNAKFIIETGEEIGSPDLRQVCEQLRDELNGRPVSWVRRTAAVGRSSHHIPRLPRRNSDSPRRESARRFASFRQLGRCACQSGNDPGQRHRHPCRRQGTSVAGRIEAAAHFKPDSRSPRRRADRADVRRAGALGKLGRGGLVGRRAALCVEYTRSAGDVVRQHREAGQRHSGAGASRPAASFCRRHQG